MVETSKTRLLLLKVMPTRMPVNIEIGVFIKLLNGGTIGFRMGPPLKIQ
jgi:hypothetical protein